MATVASALRAAGASDVTRSLIRDAHRSSTKSVYSSHWKAWYQWCSAQGLDPLRPSHIQLANHLASAAIDAGMSASALRVRRSAILTTCRQVDPTHEVPLATSSDVIRAVALRRARARVRIPSWDLRLVLRFLTGSRFEPLESASLPDLTRKTVFLVMLACGRRASEIHGLSGLPPDVRRERDGSYRLSFLPEFLAKNQSPEDLSPSVHITPLTHFADPIDADVRLCPVRALRAYIKRTKNRRQGQLRRLFLPCFEARQKDVIKSTLSRWVSSVIKDSYAALAPNNVAVGNLGLDQSKGGDESLIPLSQPRVHEVRAWSTTLAAAQSSRLEEVLRAAYWRSPNVFISCYLRDVSCIRLDGQHALSAVVAAGRLASF